MYPDEKMTERIKKVREAYISCPVQTKTKPFYYSMDRWISLGFLEGWLDNEAAITTKLRRSLAEARELDEAKPIIYDDELITGHLYFPEYEGEQKARFNSLLESFKMSTTAKGTEPSRARADHICLDYEKLLTKGISGIITEIKEKKSKLNFSMTKGLYDFDIIEKNEFYDCAIIELEAVLRLAERYSKYAAELAEKAEEPRKSELIRISENLKNVPKNPASSFYEAVQSIHFYTFNMFGLYPLGRPDRYLLPYYENDIKIGKIDRSFAQELIDNLCLGISTYVFSRAACGFIVGGSDKRGTLIENDLTYMFLTSLKHLKLPDPNGALAVNRKTSDRIIEYAVDIIGEGTTHPAIYNDEAIISGLLSYGATLDDAVDYIHSTCAEISIAGKSRMYTTSLSVNLPLELIEVVNECGDRSFEQIENAYFERIKTKLNEANKEYALKILEAKRNGHQPIRASCLVENCIDTGRDVYSGGAKYSFMQPVFIGFANLCDSLIAIKRLVFIEKRLTLKKFSEIIRNNYEGNEPLRQYIINKLPHYGNDNKEIDVYAHYLAQRLADIFDDKSLFGTSFCMPGTFSYINHANFGSHTSATFDGRLFGKSLSDGCSPMQGMDKCGPTAMMNSLTGWNQEKFLGGMVINIKFNKSVFNSSKKNTLISIIRAFIKRGGIEMQVNCIDRAILEDALLHPENHSDIIVRIGGYSDYFVKLPYFLQQEIVERTEY